MGKIGMFRPGYVEIRVCGRETERFLNLCGTRKIVLYEIIREEEGSLRCVLLARDFRQLLPVRRKTGVRIHILQKHGLPFFLAKSRKRKAFFLGLLFCVILLAVFSGRIWNIHIDGNLKNTTPEILNFLQEEGIVHGMRRSEVDCSAIAAAVRENYSDIAWVSARIEGTQLILEIKEGSFPGETEQEETPCSIEADEEGVIVKMITRTGVPQMKPGDICEKGELLVLGRLDIRNDSQEVIRYDYVHADADIYIKRNLSYYAELPVEYEETVLLDDKKTGFFVKAGDWYLEAAPGAEEDRILVQEEYPVHITENFVLPVSVGKISSRAYEIRQKTLTEKEAKAAALARLHKYEENLMEKGVQISSNNVKIEVDHETCVSRGTLEIIEKTGRQVPVEILEQPVERTTEDG